MLRNLLAARCHHDDLHLPRWAWLALAGALAGTHAAAHADEQVVITATRGSKAIDKIPGAISVIDARAIDDQLLIADDPSALLAAEIPGYAPSRQKLTGFGESMRGRSALILFDGIPQTNPLRNGAREGYFADPALIERVEVVNGASAAQGLGATGGIINFISRTPREEGTHARVDLQFATQGHRDDGMRKLGLRVEHRGAFDALAYISGTVRGVGVDGQGRRLGIEASQGDTQDSTATDGFAKVGVSLGTAQRLQLSLNAFTLKGDGDWVPTAGDRAAGVPTSAQRGTPIGQPPANRVRTTSAEWSDADLVGGDATVQAYRQHFSAVYGAGTFANFQDASIAAPGTLVDQSEIVADKHGARFSWVRPAFMSPQLELTTGLDLLHDTSKQRLALTGRDWVPPLQFRSTAPFAQLEYERGPVTLRAGARHEAAHLRVDSYRTLAAYGSREVEGGERSFSKWVSNAGAVGRLGQGWSMFVAYSEGFALPDVGLVLRSVNRDGQSVTQLVDLQPVIIDNRELGLSWRGRQGSFSASIYRSHSDLGSQVRVDNTTGVGSVQRVPIDVKGLELSAEARPSPAWTLNAVLAVTRGKTASAAGEPLDVDLGARSQGPDKLVWSAAWTFRPHTRARVQASHLAGRHINRDRMAGKSRLQEDFGGYTLVDMSIAWTLASGEWGVAVENVFDRQYVGYYAQSNPAGGNDDDFAGRGRTISVRWRYGF